MLLTKKELRVKARETLKSLHESGSLRKRSLAALKALSETDFLKNAKKILSYKALSDEINIDKLISAFPEKEWLIPETEILEGGNNSKQVIPPESFIDRCLDVDLILVPGLAFGKHGYRLGRGGGYYDRLLSELKKGQDRLFTKSPLFIVGIIPEELYLESIPYEEHDIKMDLVLNF